MTDQKMQVLEPKTEGDIAIRPPVRPFTRETGIQEVRATEQIAEIVSLKSFSSLHDRPLTHHN